LYCFHQKKSFNNTTSMSDVDEDAEAVVPTNKDILFGRGGMTKHHKGNAWFRNLMKENRILYMESPKHHKLQLVEQIVDYILSKKCHFLQKKHNAQREWFPVSYKRAVVKTSQAFRDAHRYDKAQLAEQRATGRASNLPPLQLGNMDPATLQQHLIRRSLEMYQPPQAAPVPVQRSVVLIPPPSETGEEEDNPPRVILSMPQRPAAEYYKKRKPQEHPQEVPMERSIAPPIERSVAPMDAVARQMVAIFELAARTKKEEEYAAAYSARLHAAAQASAPALYGPRPVSILARSPRAPERVSPVDKYHLEQQHQYNHGAKKKQQPIAPASLLKNWSALNQVLDRRVVDVNEDDQFADAEEEEELFPPAACAS
jgi:hypothetical protein